MSDFNIELAKQLSNSNEEYPVSMDDAWQWLDYSREDAGKRAFLNCGFVEEIDFHISVEPTTTGISGNPKQKLNMTVDAFKQWGMMSGTEKGKQIRLYFLECEKIAKQAIANQIPPEFIEMLNNMQQQMNVLTARTQRLDELEQQERDFGEAAQIHSGCAEVLLDQAYSQIDDQQMTAIEFTCFSGIDPSYARKIARTASAFEKCGKGIERCPKQQGTNHLLLEMRYLKQAAKVVLKLN